MAKRNHTDSGSAVEPRASKRHRGDADDNGAEASSSAAGASSSGDLKTVGMKMWQTLKDAEDKDGRPRSALFLAKPPKKEYPDYYALIKQPIAFDDIRKKLNHNTYTSLAQIKADFELCFSNAKTYNVEGSQVYADADVLLKLAGKTYKSLLPPEEKSQAKDEAKGPGHALNKLLKSRLKKLMELTDDSGRLVCAVFINLPPKHLKDYYREIKQPECLSNIMSRLKKKEYTSAEAFAEDIELVFRNAVQFNHAQDPIHLDAVTLREYFKELMSDLPAPYTLSKYTKPSNLKISLKLPTATQAQPAPPPPAKPTPAPARTLIPPKPVASEPSLPKAPVAVAAPAAPTGLPKAPNKVTPPVAELPKAPATVVPPAASSTQAPTARSSALPVAPNIVSLPKAPNTIVPVASTSSLPVATNTVAAPARKNTNATPVRTITTPAASSRVLRNSSTPQPAPVAAPPPTVQTYQAYQPSVIAQGNNGYHNASYPPQYSQQNVFAQQPQYQNHYVAPTPPAPPAVTAKTLTPPPPAPPPAFPLRYALLKTEPRGRNIALDHRTGVRSWSVGLAPDETILRLNNILFLEDDEGSADEGDEESDEDEDMEAPQSTTRGRGRGGKRGGRGRKKGKGTTVKATRTTQVKKTPEESRPAEIAVKLDGSSVSETADGGGWVLTVSTGSHVVELGEKTGMIWKVLLYTYSSTLMPRDKRCRYFDESGNPVRGGCRRTNCIFVHPDDSRWAAALPDLPQQSNGYGNGPGRGHSDRSRSTSSNDNGFSSSAWSSQPPDRSSNSSRRGGNRSFSSGHHSTSPPAPSANESSSGWSGSGWEAPRVLSPDWGSSNDSSKNEDSGWGNSGWDAPSTTSKDSAKDSGWGTSAWGDSSSSAWDAPSTSQPAKETSSNGGWGTGASTESGWGTGALADSGWGTGASTDSGWGTPSSTSKGWDTAPSNRPFTEKANASGWGTPSDSEMDTSTNSGWDSRPSASANNSDWGNGPVDSGWNNKGSGWDTNTTNASTTEKKAESGGWGTSSGDSAWGNKATADKAPSSAWGDSNAGSSGWGNASSPAPAWGDGKSSAWDTNTSQDLDKGKGRENPAIPFAAQRETGPPRARSSEDVEMRPPPLPHRQMPSEPDALATLEMDSHMKAYRDRIALVLKLSELHMRLSKASKAEEQWKRTQASQLYQKVKDAGKRKLDSVRMEFKNVRVDLERKVKALEKEVAKESDAAVRVSETDLAEARARVVRLQGELDRTLQEFEQTVRKEGDGAEATDTLSEETVIFQQLQERVAALLSKCQVFEFETADVVGEVPSPAALLEEAEKAQQPSAEEENLRKQLEERNAKLQALRLQLKEKKDSLKPLQTRVKASQADVEKLLAEQKNDIRLRDEVKKLVKTQQDASIERKQKLDELTEQVRNLHAVQRPSASQPFDMTSFRPLIQNMVDQILTGQVEPEMVRMQAQFQQDLDITHQDAKAVIAAKIGPIKKETDWVYDQARRLNPRRAS